MMRTADFGPSGSISGASKNLHLFSLLHKELSNERPGQRKVHPQTEAVARRTIENCPSMVSSLGESRLMNEDLSSLNRKIRSESGLNLSTLLDEKSSERPTNFSSKRIGQSLRLHGTAGFRTPITFRDGFEGRWGKLRHNGASGEL